MLLYFIRHGDPTYDPDELTPLGIRQAEALSKRLAESGIDRIFASTSNRAVQTAKPLAEITNKPITELDWCFENYAYAEFTGLDSNNKRLFLMDCDNYRKIFTSKRIRDLQFDWYKDESFADMKCGEGINRILNETEKFMEELGYKHDREGFFYKATKPSDERIALFAHAGFGSVFLSCLLDIPYPEFCIHFSMSHSDVTVIEFAGDDIVVPRVLTYSNDSHLYKENLPTKWCNEINI